MRMIVFHNDDSTSDGDLLLLRRAMSEEFIGSAFFAALGCGKEVTESRVFIPRGWKIASADACVEQYDHGYFVSPPQGKAALGDWLVISDGRYLTGVKPLSVLRRLNGRASDVVAINVNPSYRSGGELARFASEGSIAGFRRFYDDGILPGPFPCRWPHHLLIKASLFDKLACSGTIPADFGAFLSRCRVNDVAIRSVQVGGSLLDLAEERNLAEFLTRQIDRGYYPKKERLAVDVKDARVVGNVVLGKEVVVSENALIAGPSVVGNGARIASCAVVRNSVVGENVSVGPGSVIQHRVLFALNDVGGSASQANPSEHFSVSMSPDRKAQFRTWPKFSYAVAGKRIVDIFGSIAVLALLAPVFPIIAAAIKLTSSGPVLFRHKREGRHGKEFCCLKFRTMIVGSDDIQDKLRSRNQVDGPQFKLDKDPRITPVGRFLRDTFIDEIPQFINILRGEMSIVGPRPSPRSENVMCAPWRDCRLSVKPGVTGLWQVSRTRRPNRDFQEWIHYDTMYVRNLSCRLDVRLVWKTTVKLTRDFVNQF